jgi:serine/threonine protein phosphatase 1
MAGRTIAIGDIHGCAAALESVLQAIGPSADDTIITLGDHVDRGPNSRRVLEVLLELRGQCRLIPLCGNHELLMLRALMVPGNMQFWVQSGGLSTLASYGGVSNIPVEHLQFLQECGEYHETETHIFLHANYYPDRELADHDEPRLFWEHLGFVPPAPHFSRKTVIVGHTPQRSGEVLDYGHLLCIDTYCFGTGWLTALDVDSGRLWQANKLGQLRE